jgi:hypothetical protein
MIHNNKIKKVIVNRVGFRVEIITILIIVIKICKIGIIWILLILNCIILMNIYPEKGRLNMKRNFSNL